MPEHARARRKPPSCGAVHLLLRHATAAHHRRAETALEAAAPVGTAVGLQRFLEHMLATHVHFGTALDRASRLAGLETRSGVLVDALAHDLGTAAIGVGWSDASTTDAHCLGVGYALEGSFLGARVLDRRIRDADLTTPAYLEALTGEARSRWPSFLDALERCDAPEDALIGGAASVFDFIVACTKERRHV